MTPQEFGMWGLASLVWVCTAAFAVWAYALVKNEHHKMWLENQMRNRFLQQVDDEDIQIEMRED